ncbi:type II toxin-antitoxin system PemK/MazF family toxin [Arthrobacter monumenti]
MELHCGEVCWAVLDPVQGREQSGRRPVLIVASEEYLETVTALAMVLPVTTVRRNWPNHVKLAGPTGLESDSWAMTEQLMTVTRSRLVRPSGHVLPETMAAVRMYLADFLGFPAAGR